jgi:hypothetical protein
MVVGRTRATRPPLAAGIVGVSSVIASLDIKQTLLIAMFEHAHKARQPPRVNNM